MNIGHNADKDSSGRKVNIYKYLNSTTDHIEMGRQPTRNLVVAQSVLETKAHKR